MKSREHGPDKVIKIAGNAMALIGLGGFMLYCRATTEVLFDMLSCDLPTVDFVQSFQSEDGIDLSRTW